MENNWEKTILSDKVLINPGRNLSRGTLSVYVSMKNLEIGKRNIYSFEKKDFSGSGTKFKNGDTLLARITPCLENGKTAFVDFLKCNEIAHGSTEFIVLSNINNVSDNLFIYYLARSPEFRSYAISNMEGSSGRQRVPTEPLKKYELNFPPLSEQKAIARILGSLDDKIELNRQMNETLEAMAKAIFKSWFVDFDPVRAKAEGRPSGLPPHIDSLFPSSFVDSDIGPIPSGWDQTPVFNIAKYINGAAFKNEDFSEQCNGKPVIKIAELKNGITPQTKFSQKELDPKYKIDNGDILLSWSGSPDTSIDTFVWTLGPAWLNQHIFKVAANRATDRYYLFYLLKYLKPVFIEIARDKQTTGLGHFTERDLKALKICYPPEKIILEFNNSASLIFNYIFQLKLENHTLSTIRDALLPKLISGEIRVPDAEQFIKEREDIK